MSLNLVAWILVVVGAINWGLIGLSRLIGNPPDWNLVEMLLGGSQLVAILYVLVGAAGAWMLVKKMK